MKVYFILNENEVGETEEKLMGIKAVDETFRYKIFKGKEKGRYVLVVKCKDKDEAYKKGLWIRDKVFNNEKLFKVKE